jgi:uncharacterized protein DUF4160
MFSEPSERHHVPHFHAYYQENVAVFSISPVELVTGSMPQRQQRLVEAWAELHQEELVADWICSGKENDLHQSTLCGKLSTCSIQFIG